MVIKNINKLSIEKLQNRKRLYITIVAMLAIAYIPLLVILITNIITFNIPINQYSLSIQNLSYITVLFCCIHPLITVAKAIKEIKNEISIRIIGTN